MSKELLLIVESVANEKAVDKDVIFDALEAALEAATIKQQKQHLDIEEDELYPEEEPEIRVEINRVTGEYETYQCFLVTEDVAFSNKELTLEDAKLLDETAVLGNVVEKTIENVPFGRVSAHMAKQIIIQKVREAERERVYNEYADLEHTVIHGLVKRQERGNVIIDLGNNVEGVIYKENLIPREITRPGDRLRVYIKQVQRENRGHQIILSRTSEELLTGLFTIEVPEIAGGNIEIKGAARVPGVRSKVSVFTEDPRIDPAGACIGMRGSRVQNIINELANERIDVIVWNEDPKEYVINAIAPAVPTEILVNEQEKVINLSFPEEKLAIAVGSGGQNVRLASELTGWNLNVMSENDMLAITGKEQEKYAQLFTETLDLDLEAAQALAIHGYQSIEEIAFGDISALSTIEELDDETVEQIISKSSDYLLSQTLNDSGGDEADESAPIDTLEGITDDLALQLKLSGIQTWDDLAELSTNELTEITGLDEQSSAELIMKAREPWFKD